MCLIEYSRRPSACAWYGRPEYGGAEQSIRLHARPDSFRLIMRSCCCGPPPRRENLHARKMMSIRRAGLGAAQPQHHGRQFSPALLKQEGRCSQQSRQISLAVSSSHTTSSLRFMHALVQQQLCSLPLSPSHGVCGHQPQALPMGALQSKAAPVWEAALRQAAEHAAEAPTAPQSPLGAQPPLGEPGRGTAPALAQAPQGRTEPAAPAAAPRHAPTAPAHARRACGSQGVQPSRAGTALAADRQPCGAGLCSFRPEPCPPLSSSSCRIHVSACGGILWGSEWRPREPGLWTGTARCDSPALEAVSEAAIPGATLVAIVVLLPQAACA